MGITIAKCFPGHWVRTYTTTTTVNTAGSVAFVNSNTRSADSFKHGPNSIGQAGIEVHFYNESEKTIKYISFEVVANNSFGDIIGGVEKIGAVGPFFPRSVEKKSSGYIWDDPNISFTAVHAVDILYTDGTVERQEFAGGQDTKRLNYDGSMGFGTALPIITAVLFAAAVLFMNYRFLTNSAYMSVRKILEVLFPILAAAASITALKISRNKKSRKGTAIAAVIACVPALYTALTTIPVLTRYISFNGLISYFSRWYIDLYTANNVIDLLGQIGSAAMYIVLALCALGVTKTYNSKTTLIYTVYTIVSILVLGMYTCMMFMNPLYIATDLNFHIHSVIAYFGPTVAYMTAKRIRYSYRNID